MKIKILGIFPALVLSNFMFAQIGPPGGAQAIINQRGTLASIPVSCQSGQLFFATDQAAGSNLYGCTTAGNPGAWTLLGGGGGGGSGTVTSVTAGHCLSGGTITTSGTISSIGSCYAAGGGTAQAQAATYSPAITALVNGLQLSWLPSNANSGAAPTFSPNALAAKPIVKAQGSALVANDLTTTAIATAIYDGTSWELQNPQTGGAASSVPFSGVTAGTNNAALVIGGSLQLRTGTLAAIPAACTVGQTYFANDQTAGNNVYGCTSTNVWTFEGGGGSGTVTSVTAGQCLSGGTITTSGTISFSDITNPQTSTYQVLASDFSGCKTIPIASGTFTITLVASGAQPPDGQFIDLINYGSGVVTVARSGQNINGGTASLTLPAGSATAPTSLRVRSDGVNYQAAFGAGGAAVSVPFSGVQAGTNPFALVIGGSLQLLTGTLAAIPAACTVGQTYFANDQTAGHNIYGCTSTNVWTLEGGSSGGATVTTAISSNAASQTLTHNLGSANHTTNCQDSNGVALGSSSPTAALAIMTGVTYGANSDVIGFTGTPTGGLCTFISGSGTAGPTGATGATGPAGPSSSVSVTAGTSVSLTSAAAQVFVCTSTCTVTPPVPANGAQYCIYNDDNVATVITLAAIGSSSRYENTARTAYGSAGTGTFISGGAVGDMVCLIFRDSTHYSTVAYNGTWTAN